MNKKGYTLVEIIVSFSLIVLIMGLVYQMFTKEIANSKKNAYDRQISTIISVAKDYHLQNPDTTFVMVDDLKGLGLIDNEIVDPRNGTNITGCVKFIKDAYYNQYKYEYFNVSKDECQGVIDDRIAPTMTLVVVSSNNDSIVSKIVVNDEGGSGLSKDNNYQYYLSTSNINLANGEWLNYSSDKEFTITGNSIYYLWVYPVKDNAGNISNNSYNIEKPFVIKKFIFDSENPELIVEPTSGYYKDSASIKITVKDDNELDESNVYKYYLSTSSTERTGSDWIAYTSGEKFLISGTTGIRYLWVWPIKDAAGNVNDDNDNVNTPYVVGTYNFDNLAPMITTSVSYLSTTSAKVKVSYSDEGGSGLLSSNKYEYCLSTSDSQTSNCTWTKYENGIEFSVSGTVGDYYLWGYAIGDNAGNISDYKKSNSDAYVLENIKLYEYSDSFSPGTDTEFVVPLTGYYKVQLWGASGGNSARTCWNSDGTNSYTCGFSTYSDGGYGGYTEGLIKLTKGEKLYIFVGKAGTNAYGSERYAYGGTGGYNGGGNGKNDTSGSGGHSDGGGGGATDIRLVNGAWNDATSLNSRIMVAAGGGGAAANGVRANGGGLTGYGNGTVGTQSSGNSFGVGGTSSGGGYYGGNAKGSLTRAGGSSYISGHAGCNSITSESDRTHTGSAIHYSGKTFIETTMIDGGGYSWGLVKESQVQMPNPSGGSYSIGIGHKGDGAAKITYVIYQEAEAENKIFYFMYHNGVQEFTAPLTGKYKVQLWGASGGNSVRTCWNNDGTNSYTCGFSDYSDVGYGGYTEGIVSLNKNDKLYLHVGQAGTNAYGSERYAYGGTGGYNGGGNGENDISGKGGYSDGGGGGATDVRLVNGTWNDATSLNSRIMVAAGGGGAAVNGVRASGGGLTGYGNGIVGTQSSGKALGVGGTSSGGGYYGGNANGSLTRAGGSSYISGHSGCTNHTSGKMFTDTIMIDGNGYNWTSTKGSLKQMPKPGKTTSYYDSGVGHKGDGFALIKYID